MYIWFIFSLGGAWGLNFVSEKDARKFHQMCGVSNSHSLNFDNTLTFIFSVKVPTALPLRILPYTGSYYVCDYGMCSLMIFKLRGVPFFVRRKKADIIFRNVNIELMAAAKCNFCLSGINRMKRQKDSEYKTL